MKQEKNSISLLGKKSLGLLGISALFALPLSSHAQVTLEQEIKVTDYALYFNGDKKSSTRAAENDPDVGPHQYDYVYGRSLSPHGDCIKTYENFVFMTWYRGGKQDRKLMLTRYNTSTGTSVTIEFPHRHSGYSNRWWIGETHNTIGLGLSPKDGTIHMVFDQHSLSSTNPSDGSSAYDYFKYYYSKPNSLTVPDSEFTLDLFVKDNYYSANDPINAYDNPNNEMDEYKHITLTGEVNANKYQALTYPKFSLTDDGDLYLLMRKGRSKNGAFFYNKYDGSSWLSSFRSFNYTQAQSRGNPYNYGVYGEMKFAGGKLGIGFQQRANISNDRYKYQNGFFGAFIDSDGAWKNYNNEPISTPILSTDPVKVSEPGDMVTGNQVDRFSMVGGFDWNVTDRGDVHFIGKVTDNLDSNFSTKHTYVHTYRPAGSNQFITSTDFSGAEELFASGDNIYIIGLSGGRPFIEKAEGGTNNFERIYEQTSGQTFEKGVAYISEGKLYYYLLASGSGDARTTYLQIIDMGLAEDPLEGYSYAAAENGVVEVSGTMNIAYGANGQYNFLYDQTQDVSCNNATFGDPIPGVRKSCYVQEVIDPTPVVSFDQQAVEVTEGYDALAIEVTATTPSGADIDNIQLYIDGVLLRQENVTPYEWGHAGKPNELLGLSLGEHSVTAVATDSEGNVGEASTTITVVPEQMIVHSFSAQQSPNVATNLMDGDTNDDSRWSAQTFSQEVVFDLHRSKYITGTKMWTYLDRAYQYQILVSDSPDSGFTVVADKRSNTNSAQPLNANFNATGRYVKLLVTGAHNYSSNWVSITEFEVLAE